MQLLSVKSMMRYGPAEIDRRLGPFLGQRVEAFAGPAGQHHHESVVLHVVLSARGVRLRPRPVAASLRNLFQRRRSLHGPRRSLARGRVMISPARRRPRNPVAVFDLP